MSLRLFLLERYVPGWLHRRMVRDLAHVTAEALGTTPPSLARRSRRDRVAEFGAFTRKAVDVALRGKPAAVATMRARLDDGAHAMGRQARRRLGVRSHAEALRALRVFYGEIGVRLEVTGDGQGIVVHDCAFSRIYTPVVCEFISALDEGFVRGLTDGAMLAFSERITEGACTCRASLSEEPGLAGAGDAAS